MKKKVKRIPVSILGTIHLETKSAPNYDNYLFETICQLKPDLICAELTPEQAEGTSTSFSKPEYGTAIIPAAAVCGARIIPIQPSEAKSLAFVEKKRLIEEEILSSELKKKQWEMWELFESYFVEKIKKVANSSTGFGFLQSGDFDTVLFEPWYATVEQLFPAYYKIWMTWNELMIVRIKAAVEENKPENLLITVGLAHRHVFSEKLKEMQSFKLVPIKQ
jgi:hypothetical protein